MAKRKPAPPATESPSPPATSSNYTVLARRYRPQIFADLVGQEHVAQALGNALQSNRVAHAYLFTGNRGVGKTSTARILAKALNCEKGPSATPCNQCEMCINISSGEDVDVLEFDGASNRGIDEIREIRQNVQFRPSRARFKIYIIDEVHMLTREAFNALLKTLEEPPPHVKFIFATTEVQKIPVTILSRCQRFDFAGISVGRIVQQLGKILESEGIETEQEALELVARRAGGSMRDAESLLDQLLAFGGEKLTIDLVHKLLGTAHDERVCALVQGTLGGNPGEALQLLASAADEGLDLGELLDQLIEYWRDLMVVHSAGVAGQTLSIGTAYRDMLAQQAKSMSLDTILAGLDVLVGTRNRLTRGSHHGGILVEMALVRLGRLGNLVSLDQLSQWLKNAELGVRSPSAINSSTSKPLSAPSLANNSGENLKKKLLTETENAPSVPIRKALSEETLPEVWEGVLAGLPTRLAMALRKECHIAISGPNTLEIGISTRYNSLRQECQEPNRIQQFEALLQQITGHSCKVRFEITHDKAEGLAGGDSSPTPGAVRSRQVVSTAKEVPLVRRALEVLDGQVVREDEGFAQGSEGDLDNSRSAESEE